MITANHIVGFLAFTFAGWVLYYSVKELIKEFKK